MKRRNTGDIERMRVVGLIVEYNPFHNGHLYHLEQSRILSGADSVVCVMSGNFVQRGEPAMVNKWARTRMALAAGVDLVIELPAVYAMASAEYFGYGAVKLLDSLGIVDTLCFGSESGQMEELDIVARVLHDEPEEYKQLLKQALKEGISFPAARQQAVGKYLQDRVPCSDRLNLLTSSANNILGIEYLKSLKKLKSRMQPLTIPRISNQYNQQELSGSVSSATAIRKSISESALVCYDSDWVQAIPETSRQVLEQEFAAGRGPVQSADFELLILAALRRMTKDQIKQLPYIGEGLENRIKKAAELSGSLEELVDKVSTRRYTRTRIQRSLFHIITGLTAKELERFGLYGGPQYVRVLGFNGKGRELLAAAADQSMLPVIVKPANYKNSCNVLLKRMLEIEAMATDLYVLGYSRKASRTAGQEFTQEIIRMI